MESCGVGERKGRVEDYDEWCWRWRLSKSLLVTLKVTSDFNHLPRTESHGNFMRVLGCRLGNDMSLRL